jgi:hypothetical protein
VEGLPKTEQSIRDIDMLEPVYDLLRHHRGETLLRSDYVFLNQGGRPVDLTTLRRRLWYPGLVRGGVRRRALYQTRHTYATLMLATGENPEWIAKQLGHTSTQMLFQRYAKFIPNVTRQDGTAFLRAYRQWFPGPTGIGDVGSQGEDGRGQRPLGYDGDIRGFGKSSYDAESPDIAGIMAIFGVWEYVPICGPVGAQWTPIWTPVFAFYAAFAKGCPPRGGRDRNRG